MSRIKPLLILLFLSILPAYGQGATATSQLLDRMAGKWRGEGTLNQEPGCTVTFTLNPMSVDSAAIQYQIQCPGYQNQNQFTFDSRSASSITGIGFTQTKSTDWFGVIETDTLEAEIRDSEPTADGSASHVDFHLKIEKSGRVTEIRADLARDPR